MGQLIVSDQIFANDERAALAALLDVLIPASEDGRMPSGRDSDLSAHLASHAAEFVEPLHDLLAALGEDFAEAPFDVRLASAETLEREHPDAFRTLLIHAMACYYQRDDVQAALGMSPGAPFPRGNEVATGDLSLLDPVMRRSKLYRE